MSMIDRISGAAGVGRPGPDAASDAARIAHAAAGDLGHRMLAWSGHVAGASPAAVEGWSRLSGAAPNGFRADDAVLARGGDVYGLRDLAAGLSADLGATPAEEGRLLRALEDLASAAALAIHGAAGSGEAQGAPVAAALDRALTAGGPDGVDGVVIRLEALMADLGAQLGL